MHREITTEAQYRFDDAPPYASRLTVVPHTGERLEAPELGRCESTGRAAPKECLGRCAMTGVEVLRHLLVRIGESAAVMRLPEHTLRCSLSGKRILMDEAELSAVTRKARRELPAQDLPPDRQARRAGAFRALRFHRRGSAEYRTRRSAKSRESVTASISNCARRSRARPGTRRNSCSAMRPGSR